MSRWGHSCPPNDGQKRTSTSAALTPFGSWRVFDRRIEMRFSRSRREARRIFGDESGQTLVFVVLSMTLLLGFLGFAADVGTLFYAKRQIQTAADAAAIAGAAELNYGNWSTAAQDAAAQNHVANGSGGSVVTVNSPPLYGNYNGLSGYVEAIVSQPQSTIFMGMFGRGSVTVTARAVGHWGSSRTCIATLGTSGTGISVTTSSSNPTLNAPLCGISDNSSLTVTSSGASHPIVANSIGVSGSYSHTGGTVSPAPVVGIVPVSDPLAYLAAPPSGPCLSNLTIVASGGTVNIPQGNYCSGISITASGTTVNFAPGTYTISGGLSITGSGITINGTDVTFYIQSGALNVTPSLGVHSTLARLRRVHTTGFYSTRVQVTPRERKSPKVAPIRRLKGSSISPTLHSQ